jgi:hypothetical protein
MNIFASDKSPIISAQNLDDKRVGKLIIETAQMLCNAAEFFNIEIHAPYTLSKSHKNHPCALWTHKNKQNFIWLIEHYVALSSEWEYRRGKVHGASRFVQEFAKIRARLIQENSFGEVSIFVNAARNTAKQLDFRCVDNVNLAYRLYLSERWKTDIRKPVWTNRQKPEWEECR